MPITITITDPTPEQIAALFGTSNLTPIYREGMFPPPPETEKPKATRKKPATPDGGMVQAEPAADPEEAELAREIAADIAQAASEPKGATQVVDAGTGQPIAQAEVSLTMDEVRANATRLAQADSAQLKAILGEFGAAKLSEVAPDQLPDFAARVLAALG